MQKEKEENIPEIGINALNHARFTTREKDIIACIIGGRSAKKISSLLKISTKTVHTHIRNIMIKLECNSRENIIDYFEKEKKYTEFREFYENLVINNEFEKDLQKVALSIQRDKQPHLIIYSKKYNKFTEIEEKIINYLRIIGFHIVLNPGKDYLIKNDDYILHIVDQSEIKYFLSKSKIKNNYRTTNICRSSYLVMGPLYPIMIKNLENNSIINYIHFASLSSYYFSFFQLLAILIPTIDNVLVNQLIQRYKDPIKPSNTSIIVKPNHHIKNNVFPLTQTFFSFLSFLKKKHVLLYSIIISIFFLSNFIFRDLNHQHKGIIKDDLAIPSKEHLLNRPYLIDKIDKALSGPQGISTVIITGISGSGKTTLARHYSRLQEKFTVFEINAQTPNSIANSFINIAYSLCQNENEKKILKSSLSFKNTDQKYKELIKFVQERLRKLKNWILIYDDVQNFSTANFFFPYDHNVWGAGKVIITSTNSSIENPYIIHKVPIYELNGEEKYKLFKSIINLEEKLTAEEKNQVDTLLRHIPPFPLDILIAAYCIKRTKISYKNYLKNILKSAEDLDKTHEMTLESIPSHNKTRYKIITLMLENIIKKDSKFLEFFLLISLLDSKEIPYKLFSKNKGYLILRKLLNYMKEYSFILNETDKSFSLHKSIQRVILFYFKNNLNKNDINKYLELNVIRIEEFLDKIIHKQHYDYMTLWLNHGAKIIDNFQQVFSEQKILKIKYRVALIYYHLDRYQEAQKEFNELLIKIKNKNNALEASIYNYLGIISKELGNYKRAKNFLDKSVQIQKQFSSLKTLETALSFLHLGSIYREFRDYEQAELVLKESIKILTQNYGNNLMHLITAQTFLGDIYRTKGKFEDAFTCYHESFKISQKFYGNSHPKTANILIYLGNTYENLGEYQKAKNALKNALKIFRKFYSENNIKIATAKVYLGNIYRLLGCYKKAEAYLEESLDLHQEHYGKNSIKIAWNSICLAEVYTSQKKYNEALKLIEPSLKVHQRHYGDNSHKIGWIKLVLGRIYKGKQDYLKAMTYYNDAYLIYKNHYGSNHVLTALVLKHQADVHIYNKEFNKALICINEGFKIMDRNNHIEKYKFLKLLAKLNLRKLNNHNELYMKNNLIKIVYIARDYIHKAQQAVKDRFPVESTHFSRIRRKILELENLDSIE